MGPISPVAEFLQSPRLRQLSVYFLVDVWWFTFPLKLDPPPHSLLIYITPPFLIFPTSDLLALLFTRTATRVSLFVSSKNIRNVQFHQFVPVPPLPFSFQFAFCCNSAPCE